MQLLLDHDLLFEAMQQTHNDNESKHRNHKIYEVAPIQLIKMAKLCNRLENEWVSNATKKCNFGKLNSYEIANKCIFI